MLSREVIEKTIIIAAQQRGLDLDDKDLLDIRTSVAASHAISERQSRRMKSPAYQWSKPEPRR